MTAPGLSSLHRVRMFVAVSERGGFSAAARSSGVSQSMLSTHVRHLEVELGTVLVDRTARSFTLTAAGTSLLDGARELLALADRTVATVARHAATPLEGTFLLGATTTAGEEVVPALLRIFLDAHPGLDVDLTVDNTGQITQRLLAGEIPLAVVAGEVEDPRLSALPMGAEPQVLLAAADHPLAGVALEPRHLRGATLLLRERGSASRRHQETAFAGWGVSTARTSTVTGTAALLSAVAHGLGITCLPRVAARDALGSGRVVVLPVSPAPPPRSVHLVRRTDRVLTTVEEVFLDHVTSTLANPRLPDRTEEP